MALLHSQDRIALEIYEAAAREYLATNRKRRFARSRYLGMSQLGEACDLALWYDFRSFTRKPFDGRVALIFGDGNHYEGKVIKYLRLAGYEVEHAGPDDQLEFSWHNDLCRGHADGVIHKVTNRPHILEIKSANRKRFDAFRNFGIRNTAPAYYCQVQCYMLSSGLERALMVVYCKDSSEIYTERIYFVRQEAEALKQRAYTIITANDTPERPFPKDSFQCKLCNYRLHCWTEEGAIMADDRTCGSCWYLWWKGLKPCCLHPEHPFFLHTWGMCCSDWSDLCDKEIGPHKLNRPPKATLDQVVEAP